MTGIQKKKSKTPLNLDLFGGETPVYQKPTGPYQLLRAKMEYRKSNDPVIRCKNCKYLMRIKYHEKTYFKCQWIGCSASQSSDIILSAVCRRFDEQKTENQ